MAIYKCGRGLEPGSAVKHLQIALRSEHERGNSGFQVQYPNRSATLPPLRINSQVSNKLKQQQQQQQQQQSFVLYASNICESGESANNCRCFKMLISIVLLLSQW